MSYLPIWLAVLACFGSRELLPDKTTLSVNSLTMEVHYSVPAAALPLKRVEMWYCSEDRTEWKYYAQDQDLASPIQFEVHENGIYGVYFVLENAHGLSSGPPRSDQDPHQWILVDTIRPLTQIKQVRIIEDGQDGRRLAAISWSAYDRYLPERPTSLYYQTREKPDWRPIQEGIRNVGRLDWEIPAQVHGQIEFKIMVTDQAGNIAFDVSDPVWVESPAPTSQVVPDTAQIQPTRIMTASSVETSSETDSDNSTPEARKLYEVGLWHKERGDYGLAAERLVEALNLDPQLSTAAYGLAEIYYNDGNYSNALDIYQNVIERDKDDRTALRGSALALVALNRYSEALSHLERILQTNPDDAETWLHAGDVLVYMGRMSQANNYWQQAVKLAPSNSQIKDMAKRRMKTIGNRK